MMDPLRLLRPLVQAGGDELQVTGRELLGLIVASRRSSLYRLPPAWVQTLCLQVGTEQGVSPALLEAISGELTKWDPAHGTDGGHRIGLMGLPEQIVRSRETMVAELHQLERGDIAAAHRVRSCVTRAAVAIVDDLGRLDLVHVLEYYAGLGRSAEDPSGRELARRIVGRYLWGLLERCPRDRASELLDSFGGTPDAAEGRTVYPTTRPGR